ncbi:hypothetical protein C7447_101215 [Tenacibaculum adriaticum]|uniref:Uncharacterized protein n=1 Tax=Tenacibaculum adriaticum TaxID=413713 RepID=A0A5S5DUV2_9FLAO|nr:hypothetical protein [Tenacibaculum adriaticum]TYP99615.1 hypothetical protein C7447_101215 [Tenacibaculum adriaticum]
MHKKLASDLTSLAHSILQMKNKEDIFALKEKAYEVYEKLALLAYVEEYINTTPNATISKEELITKIAEAEIKKEQTLSEPIPETTTNTKNELTTSETNKNILIDEKMLDDIVEEVAGDIIEQIEEENLSTKIIEETTQEIKEVIEQPFDELENILFKDSAVKDEAQFIENLKTPTLEDELQDTISVDIMANLFEKAEPKKTLNDQLQGTMQIGLNDRIAFVKHLFDGNQNDFNRVISQLNTFKTEKEAKKFINKIIKPDYDWSEKEEYETRFLEIIERKFI